MREREKEQTVAATVLVVDDEPGMVRLLTLYLHRAGYSVLAAGSGAEALETLEAHGPDLVVLDIGLPDIDGYSVCRQIRERDDTPIVMLTARGEPRDRVTGLQAGADDYVSKPFQPEELVLRVQAVLRRGNNRREHTQRYTVGELCVDTAQHLVTLAGKPVELRPKEFDLLLELISHPNQVFTREQLVTRVWGYEYIGDDSTLDVHVWRLRQKLGETGRRTRYIQTVWGVGYSLRADADGT